MPSGLMCPHEEQLLKVLLPPDLLQCQLFLNIEEILSILSVYTKNASPVSNVSKFANNALRES